MGGFPASRNEVQGKTAKKNQWVVKGGGAPEPTAAPKARAPVLAPAPAAALALAPAPLGAIVTKRKQGGVWLSRFETGGATHKGGGLAIGRIETPNSKKRKTEQSFVPSGGGRGMYPEPYARSKINIIKITVTYLLKQTGIHTAIAGIP